MRAKIVMGIFIIGLGLLSSSCLAQVKILNYRYDQDSNAYHLRASFKHRTGYKERIDLIKDELARSEPGLDSSAIAG